MKSVMMRTIEADGLQLTMFQQLVEYLYSIVEFWFMRQTKVNKRLADEKNLKTALPLPERIIMISPEVIKLFFGVMRAFLELRF